MRSMVEGAAKASMSGRLRGSSNDEGRRGGSPLHRANARSPSPALRWRIYRSGGTSTVPPRQPVRTTSGQTVKLFESFEKQTRTSSSVPRSQTAASMPGRRRGLASVKGAHDVGRRYGLVRVCVLEARRDHDSVARLPDGGENIRSGSAPSRCRACATRSGRGPRPDRRRRSRPAPRARASAGRCSRTDSRGRIAATGHAR